MATSFELLPGLPSSGPLPRWVPADWVRTGREGLVVRFRPETADPWVANFAPGLGGWSGVVSHPNGHDLLVVAGGDPYRVDGESGVIEEHEYLGPVFAVWTVPGSADLVVNVQGLAFLRLGPEGVIWHSRRLSWDGFRNVAIDSEHVSGDAWSPVSSTYYPFSIDIASGRSLGGAPEVPDQAWEDLAE